MLGGRQLLKSRRGRVRFGTLLAVLSVAILAFSGCQSLPDTPSLPRLPELPAPAVPTLAQESTPALRATLTPTPRSVAPASTIPADRAAVPRLNIAPVPGRLPDYDRKDWKHWTDADRDCQNTRAEVLIAESTAPVTFTREKECTVATGRWLDPFTGTTFTDAGDLDVDHLVPLANAHRSGGWRWSADRKRQFANSLAYANHLAAVSAAANRAKGAKGPEGWQPPNPDHHCQYARDWIAVKDEWGLTATAAEWAALAEMLGEC